MRSSTRLAKNTPVLRGDSPLSEEQMHLAAPSIARARRVDRPGDGRRGADEHGRSVSGAGRAEAFATLRPEEALSRFPELAVAYQVLDHAARRRKPGTRPGRSGCQHGRWPQKDVGAIERRLRANFQRRCRALGAYSVGRSRALTLAPRCWNSCRSPFDAAAAGARKRYQGT